MDANTSDSSHADEIIPAALWPTAHGAAEDAATDFSGAVEGSSASSRSYGSAAQQFSDTTTGGTAEALIRTHKALAVDHGNHAEIRREIALAAKGVERLGHELTLRLKTIESQARDEISSSLAAERETIVAVHRARAVAAHAEFAEAVSRQYSRAAGRVMLCATGIVGRTAPLAPPPTPDSTDSTSGDPDSYGERGSKTDTEIGDPSDTDQDSYGSRQGKTNTKVGDPSDSDQDSYGPRAPIDGGHSEPVPNGVIPTSPGSGLGGGGFSSLGSLNSMTGGGGFDGLGSGGGLSGLTSGGLPGAQAGGLGGGLPSGTPAATSVPQAATSAGAFSQGLSAGSNAGSALSSLPPATSTGSATTSSGQAAAATPAAGLGNGVAPSAGVGAAGAAPTVAGSGPGAESVVGNAAVGLPGAMMVPPPGMGAPAGPSAGGGTPGAPVIPAGGAGSSSGTSGSMGAGPPGAGSNGAMLVPASVVAFGSASSGQRQRLDSQELTSAKALALKLRRNCDGAKYPCIEWAVGIFRSEVGGATECVVTSNEGFGFIPWGVFLPRSARLLSADTLVDNDFRDRWFGCKDPVQVMAAYAKQRGQCGSRLVALAMTSESSESRIPGVEYGVCPPRNLNELCSQPVLDDMHAHRLEVVYPDLFARLQRFASNAEATRAFASQVCVPLAIQMIDAVHMVANVQSPAELRQMWDVLGTGDVISEEDWQAYLMASMVFYVNLSASRLPLDAGVAERERYRAQWVAARTMEFLRGWQRTPPDVADMVYAAAVAYPGDFAVKLEPLLRAPEAALAK